MLWTFQLCEPIQSLQLVETMQATWRRAAVTHKQMGLL